MNLLQEILPKLRRPSRLPPALPLIHISKSKYFKDIIKHFKLSTFKCEIFKKHLLYFSYGDVFYATGDKASHDKTKAPVCFLFNPKMLSEINYYYPYDTGAAQLRKYGDWSDTLTNFKRYRIVGNGDWSIACQLVYYIYGSNLNYRKGKVKPLRQRQRKLFESFPELYQFLESDIQECDRRQCTIECQSESDIVLRQFLEWIAFPNSSYYLFVDLFNKMQPSPPVQCPYELPDNYHPREILGEIRSEARKYIETKYFMGNRQ